MFKKTKNIGDDIQSYAAAKLLPQVDYLIERESLDVFRPDGEEPVNVIVNGWFMYNKLGWPISPCINPLYISMHFWKDDAMEMGDLFLRGLGGDDLKEHQPIGCRDEETQSMLENAGIKTWLSGCVTLTLKDEFPITVEKDYICLVDVPAEVEAYVRKQCPDTEIRRIVHESDTIINEQMSWEERFCNVEKLLTVYQNAKVVITTRLHCALPCLGLMTPVLMVREESVAEKGRFDGLYSLLNCTTGEELIGGKSDYDISAPLPNPDRYLYFRNGVKKRVDQFLEKSESEEFRRICKERFKRYDGEWEKRALWKNEVLYEIMRKSVVRWKEQHYALDELQRGKDWLEEQYLNYKQAFEEAKRGGEELQKGKDWLEEQYLNYRRELEETNKEEEKLKRQNTQLEEDNHHLRQIREELDNEKRNLTKEIAALTREREKLISETNKLKVSCSQLQQENAAYCAEISGLLNSYTWKTGRAVTAVPRKLAGWIKKE